MFTNQRELTIKSSHHFAALTRLPRFFDLIKHLKIDAHIFRSNSSMGEVFQANALTGSRVLSTEASKAFPELNNYLSSKATRINLLAQCLKNIDVPSAYRLTGHSVQKARHYPGEIHDPLVYSFFMYYSQPGSCDVEHVRALREHAYSSAEENRLTNTSIKTSHACMWDN
uniref:Uncharacterized protein n=1 Tax=Glossina pallidipes TaxID=7398 RepID=A0A1B0AA52_GLOPL